MSFWGVEIKPSKPFTLYRPTDTHQGKLQISQATLGAAGGLTKRSVVQCNIGDKSPVLLCALLPDKIESCFLNLQFDEEDEVIFSVLGARSVHLTGFYLGTGKYDHDEDSDSYGEDIVETDNEDDQSADNVEDDDDLGDFIVDDDDDIEMTPPPKDRKSALVSEITDDYKIPANRKRNRRRLKKKYQVSESDVDNKELDCNQLRNERNGSSDPGTWKKLKQESNVQVSIAEQISEPPKDSSNPSTDIGQESNVNGKKKKKRSRSKDGDVKTENIDTKEQLKISEPPKDSSTPSTDIGQESNVKAKKKKKRNRSADGDAKTENIDTEEQPKISEPLKDFSTASTDIGQESNVKAKKKKKRSCSADGDAKTESIDTSNFKAKNKMNRSRSADGDAKTENINTKEPPKQRKKIKGVVVNMGMQNHVIPQIAHQLLE